MHVPAGLGLAVLLVVGGCSSAKPAEAPVAPPASSAPAAPAAVPAAAAGAAIGAKGSACELPISFSTAADWKAKPIDVKKLGELAALAKVGDFTVVCEIDAKPAGSIGFIRVHVADGLSGAPAEHLQEFVKVSIGKKEASNTDFTDVQIGGAQAAEATWETVDKEYDIRSRYAAFALNTKRGMVVVQLSPLDTGEFTSMQPAYELAKTSVKI
ncbi:lipoprotein [Actinoplanes sichuanensis]|uniref:Lipoprotein n=1 Tax=Actinoplanes sichuanensis TaxID=512349 RepID=A0ABW4AYG0_9ACTN|nr:lipoprotein [Actinoplanes sichuanensis]